jgi:hypothetical protein
MVVTALNVETSEEFQYSLWLDPESKITHCSELISGQNNGDYWVFALVHHPVF